MGTELAAEVLNARAPPLPENGAAKAEKSVDRKKAVSRKIRVGNRETRAARIFPAFHSTSAWPITSKNMKRTSSREKAAGSAEISRRLRAGKNGSAGVERAAAPGRGVPGRGVPGRSRS
jgi:hypothetical protein